MGVGGGGRSNLFSADDISMIVIAFEPPRHVHVKPSDKNEAELD